MSAYGFRPPPRPQHHHSCTPEPQTRRARAPRPPSLLPGAAHRWLVALRLEDDTGTLDATLADEAAKQLLSDGAMAPDGATRSGQAGCEAALAALRGLVSGGVFECEIMIHGVNGRRQFCLVRLAR